MLSISQGGIYVYTYTIYHIMCIYIIHGYMYIRTMYICIIIDTCVDNRLYIVYIYIYIRIATNDCYHGYHGCHCHSQFYVGNPMDGLCHHQNGDGLWFTTSLSINYHRKYKKTWNRSLLFMVAMAVVIIIIALSSALSALSAETAEVLGITRRQSHWE